MEMEMEIVLDGGVLRVTVKWEEMEEEEGDVDVLYMLLLLLLL